MAPKTNIRKNNYTTDRIVFDRSMWMICYKTNMVNCDDNKFDPELINFHDLEDFTSITRFKGFGKETVLRQEIGSGKPYLTWELRLKHTRSMNVYFNFNRYFNNINHTEHDPDIMLHDDNFIPIESKISLSDYLKVYKETFPKQMTEVYETWYKKLWPKHWETLNESGELPICKCKTLEVAREMSPMNVGDIGDKVAGDGGKVTRWNNISNLMHFGEEPKGQKFIELQVDGTTLKSNLTTWKYKEPYEKVRQSKLYQKCVGMGRFEITLYDDQIDFNSNDPEVDVMFTLDEYLESAGIHLETKSNYKHHRKTIKDLAKFMKIKDDLLQVIMSSGKEWISTRANKVNTKKLHKCGLIEKHHKGRFRLNDTFLKLIELTEPGRIEQNNEYIPRYL